jgi:tetratricopeptide (TPR) repeat protein
MIDTKYLIGLAAGAVGGLAIGVPLGSALLGANTEQPVAAVAPAPAVVAPAALAAVAADSKLTAMIEQSRQALNSAQPERALLVLREAERVDPKNPSIQNNLCVALIGLQRYDEAIAACNAAIGLQQDFQLARNNLAWAQAERTKAQNTSATEKAATDPTKKIEAHGAAKVESTAPPKKLEPTSPAKADTAAAPRKLEAPNPVKAATTAPPLKLEETSPAKAESTTPPKKLEPTSPTGPATINPPRKVETFPAQQDTTSPSNGQ